MHIRNEEETHPKPKDPGCQDTQYPLIAEQEGIREENITSNKKRRKVKAPRAYPQPTAMQEQKISQICVA